MSKRSKASDTSQSSGSAPHKVEDCCTYFIRSLRGHASPQDESISHNDRATPQAKSLYKAQDGVN